MGSPAAALRIVRSLYKRSLVAFTPGLEFTGVQLPMLTLTRSSLCVTRPPHVGNKCHISGRNPYAVLRVAGIGPVARTPIGRQDSRQSSVSFPPYVTDRRKMTGRWGAKKWISLSDNGGYVTCALVKTPSWRMRVRSLTGASRANPSPLPPPPYPIHTPSAHHVALCSHKKRPQRQCSRCQSRGAACAR